MSKILILLSALNICALNVNAARILGVIPTASYSHQVAYQQLWRELSLRNHEMTVITTNPMNDPELKNLTEIDLSCLYQEMNAIVSEIMKDEFVALKYFLKSFILDEELVGQQLQHPKVQGLIKNESEHFDVLLVECSYLPMLAFAERFKCPTICLLSLDGFGLIYRKFGNPTHIALQPQMALQSEKNWSFQERLVNVFYYAAVVLFFEPFMTLVFDGVVIKYFGTGYPSITDLFNNISLLFINSDLVFHPIRPLVPSIIQIGGGTHIQPPKPLPKQLQSILDESKQGFIYFSLGGNIKSKDLPEAKRTVLMDVFAELPYTVLWKSELETMPGKPDNVIISKWFPQQDILKHPNIKLFITHGGLQSVDEAIYHHVPIIGIPFYVDQPYNVKRMVSRGCGLKVDYEDMDRDTLKKTILDVINNSSYRNRIKELAALVKDQPMTGLERAVWWTEYVIRHKGAKHLRSPLLDIPTYQYLLLDVIAFCLIVTYFLIVTCKFLVRSIRRLRNWRNQKIKVQ